MVFGKGEDLAEGNSTGEKENTVSVVLGNLSLQVGQRELQSTTYGGKKRKNYPNYVLDIKCKNRRRSYIIYDEPIEIYFVESS